MENAAYSWWNKVINDVDDCYDVPTLIDPEEIGNNCQKLSPIFHTYVNLIYSRYNYWDDIYKCAIKLTDDYEIQNPKTDFPSFVESLYKHRKLILVETVDSAINFAQRFCPETNNTFFENEFLFGVSDPLLAVNAMHKMNSEHIEPWVTCIEQNGALQRFFDLFITYLQPANHTSESKYEGFRVILADILTSLIVSRYERNRDNGEKLPPRIEEITLSLYSRLLNLMNYCQTEESISFARFSISLLDASLPTFPFEQRMKHIIALMSAAPSGRMSHSMVVMYAISQAAKKNIYYTLVTQQVAKNVEDSFDFYFLDKLAHTVHDSRALVVKVLSESLTHNKLNMRAAGKLLSKIFQDHTQNEEMIKKDEDIIEWFKSFIDKLFISFYLSASKCKYLRRIHGICEILGGESFMCLKFIREEITKCANSLIIISRNEAKNPCDFLLDYFEFNPKATVWKPFEKELAKARKMPLKLKSFPFKFDSYQLVEFNKKKAAKPEMKAIAIATEASRVDCSDYDVSPKVSLYLFRDENASTIDQQNCIFTLEDFIDREKLTIEKVHAKKIRKKSAKPDMTRFKMEGKFDLTGLRTCLTENKNEIVDYQYRALSEFISIARDLITVIKSQEYVLADTRQLSRDLNKGCFNDKKYKMLKRRKLVLRKCAAAFSRKYIANMYDQELLLNITKHTWKYNNELQYAPPFQDIETLLCEFIKHSAFNGILEAMASVLEDGSIDACVGNVWELNNSIIDFVKAPFNENAIILYNTLLRLMFDAAYYLHPSPCLTRYKTASKKFLRRAEEYAMNPMSRLKISVSAIGTKKQNKTIRHYFERHAIHFSLEFLQFYTNPIDICISIYSIVSEIPSLSLTGKLTEEETEKMLLGIIVCFPPVNTISIVRFLIKWGNLISSIPVVKARNMFIRAVSSIFSLDGEGLDDVN